MNKESKRQVLLFLKILNIVWSIGLLTVIGWYYFLK